MPLLFFFLLITLNAAAVNADDDHEYKTPGPMAMGIQHNSINHANINDSEYQLSISRTRIKLPIGKYHLLGQIFIPQVSMEEITFDIPNPDFNRKSMYSIKLPMLFIEKYNDNWTRILNITPSWHTDLKARDEDSYSLMGLILWRYRDDSPHSYTMGAGINRLFGEYKPIPIISYSYRAENHTRYDLGFPVTKVEHRTNQNWSLFSAVAPIGGNWRYELGNQERVNLSYSSWTATVGFRRHLSGQFWLTLEAGRTFARKIDLNNNDSIDHEADIADANIIMLTLGLHP